MATARDSLSVLVVDDDPAILALLGRLLGSNNVRALLARDSQEAIGIAERNYVPIDLVLANVRGLDAPDLLDRLGKLRPEVPLHYMSANVDSGVIRVDWMLSTAEAFATLEGGSSEGRGLIESIRAAAAPRAFRHRSIGQAKTPQPDEL